MGRCHPRAGLLAAVALCALLAAPTQPADARPDGLVLSVAVSLTPDTLTAEISNSQEGAVHFGGNVTVGKLPNNVQRVTVTLDASCIWEATVSPSTMVFTSDEPQPFHLTVVVPPKTHAGSNVAIVHAHATDGFQSADGSAQCTVQVAQYYKLSLGVDVPYMEVPDSPATVDGALRIYNEGNGRDTFRVEMVDMPDALADYDIEETVTIPPEDHAEVEFTLFIDVGGSTWEGTLIEVTFRVSSTGSATRGMDYAQDYLVHIYVQSARDRFERDWPRYVGWGVGLGVLGAVAMVMVRRRRRRRKDREG